MQLDSSLRKLRARMELAVRQASQYPAPAAARGNVRRAASWARRVALATLPGQFRAVKLRAAVETYCDWSMLRKAALDITLGCWPVDVTRSPAWPHCARRPKGAACNLRCSLKPLGGWPGRQLVSLTPQQVLFCGFAIACEPSFMRLVRFQQQNRLDV